MKTKMKRKYSPKPFLTGSRVYGKPTSESDIDLVVLISDELLTTLLALSTKAEKEKITCGTTRTDSGPNAASLIFGRLNLVAVTSLADYEVWRKGTETLKDWKNTHKKPVTRAKAIKHFAKLRKALAEKRQK